MHTQHRGFIPLVAIVVLGLIAITGGTIAAVSLRESKVEPVSTTSLPQEEADLAPVSVRDDSLETNEDFTQIEIEVTVPEVFDKSEVQAICTEAKEQEVPATPSLIGQILPLCDKVLQQNSGVDFEHEANSLKKKWELWQKTQEAQSRR